jgi:hypothetical protein
VWLLRTNTNEEWKEGKRVPTLEDLCVWKDSYKKSNVCKNDLQKRLIREKLKIPSCLLQKKKGKKEEQVGTVAVRVRKRKGERDRGGERARTRARAHERETYARECA